MFSIYCMYDKVTEKYGYPIAFENDDLAYASCRRTTRDLFTSGKLTEDAVSDNKFIGIAYYDDFTGRFTNIESPISFECTEFIKDLIGDDGSEI